MRWRLLAAAGFVAFAADLYHGKIAKTIPEATALGGALDARQAQAEADVAEAARFVLDRAGQPDGALAVIGFSLGAAYAVIHSVADPDHVRQVVTFYGSMPMDFSASKASYLGHFVENDAYEPQENTDAMEAALRESARPVQFHVYAGTKHWFFEPDRVAEFNLEAAKLAWERTLAFLNSKPIV